MRECKKTHRTEEEKKQIENRLNRIEGQLNGIRKMIADDVYCNDLLIQVVAVENSMKSLSNHILEKHLNTCIKTAIENQDKEIVNEMIDLFKRFNK